MTSHWILTLAAVFVLAACVDHDPTSSTSTTSTADSSSTSDSTSSSTGTGVDVPTPLPDCVNVGEQHGANAGAALCDGGTVKASDKVLPNPEDTEHNTNTDAACKLAIDPDESTTGCIERYASGGWGYWKEDAAGADKLADCICEKAAP